LALPRKLLPARLAIFVAQLGRKFRLFFFDKAKVQKIQSIPNYFSKKARKKALTLKTHTHASQISDLSFLFCYPLYKRL